MFTVCMQMAIPSHECKGMRNFQWIFGTLPVGTTRGREVDHVASPIPDDSHIASLEKQVFLVEVLLQL